MSLTAVPNTPAAENDKLEMLRINIRHWRKEKGLAFRFMPAPYWDEAIMLARLLNVRRVACVLGLNVEELKRRMEGRQSPGGYTAVQAPVEPDTPGAITPRVCDLPDIAVTPPSAPTACASSVAEPGKTPSECKVTASPEPAARPLAESPRAVPVCTAEEAVVEITAANGDRMTLRMPVGSFNVSSLIHEFRSRA
jgi:hypothetical protein